ncbi:MAG: threonine/serine exporter family protein [Clostridium sp.]|nr:threonine/serine exporter family protein [Clostridium sp.]
MDLIIQITTCVLGTIAFAITMNAPKKALLFISVGGIISASIERILSLYTNDFSACFTAMLALCFYCEITARIIKEPTTITLMPSTIPLLPGSSIYYTMLSAINGDMNLVIQYGKSTLLAGLGIALGAVISSTVIKIIYALKKIGK